MKSVLFVNHTERHCGVYQYGLDTAYALEKSTKYNFRYVECGTALEFQNSIYVYEADAVIFNYSSPLAQWLSSELAGVVNVPTAALAHDSCCPFPSIRWHIHIDPTHPECEGHFSVGRPIPEWKNWGWKVPEDQKVLTIGSFGFGFGSKVKLIELVQSQFDVAHIRLHIPFAHFGDHDGKQARLRAHEALRTAKKPGITVTVTHDFMEQEDMLNWLAGNTLNAFIYDVNYGRGCASTTDLALAVPRPIAISDSWQFRHLESPLIRVERNSLRDIIARGVSPTYRERQAWTHANLCADYERIVDRMLA